MDVPVVTAVPPFPSMSLTPQTNPITTAVNDKSAITINLYVENHAMLGNMSNLNNYDDVRKCRKVDNFDSLIMDFHNTNKSIIAKKETLSPSTK